MKCSACGHEAELMWVVEVGKGRAALCLDCQSKYQQIQVTKHNMLVDEMNYLAEEIDFVSGFPGSPRYRRVPSITQINPRNESHITVNADQIGIVNSGSIGEINSAITLTKQSNNPQIGDDLRSLTELILSDKDVTNEIRDSLIESLAFLAEQLKQDNQSRKRSMISTVLVNITSSIGAVTGALGIWEKVKPFFESCLK